MMAENVYSLEFKTDGSNPNKINPNEAIKIKRDMCFIEFFIELIVRSKIWVNYIFWFWFYCLLIGFSNFKRITNYCWPFTTKLFTRFVYTFELYNLLF